MASEWTSIWCGDDKSRAAALSWFRPVCDGMTVEKAEILCDIDTDQEKKIRAIVIDANGVRRMAERTLGRRQYTISLKPC